MSQRSANYHERIRSHVLFIPGLIALLGIGFAIGMVELDRALALDKVRGVPWIFRAGAGGAREVLSTIAASMVQLAGITFSVTVVALALRSQQFGPRLLRNFTRDSMNQVVLGTFVATAIYALLVLRAVRDLDDAEAVDDETFVPLIATTVAVILAIVALGLFILFIHRVVEAIQANTVIAGAAKEARETIERLFPETVGEGRDEPSGALPDPPEDAVPVHATGTGYVQFVDAEALMATASKGDLRIWMRVPVGGFVGASAPLAQVAGLEGGPDSDMAAEVRKAFRIGRNRTVVEDPEFGAQQIVDLAVKALSPSDNDPTTASTAVDHLGVLLAALARRDIPSRARRDDRGVVRVYAMGPTFESMTSIVFDDLRSHLKGVTPVILAALRALDRVGASVGTPARREVLWRHALLLAHAASREVKDNQDRERIDAMVQSVGRTLARSSFALKEAKLSPVPET